VHDGPAGALQALVRPVDELGPALHQHLDGDVVRDQVVLDEQADEVVVGLRRRRNPTSISLNPILTRVSNSVACAPGPSGR